MRANRAPVLTILGNSHRFDKEKIWRQNSPQTYLCVVQIDVFTFGEKLPIGCAGLSVMVHHRRLTLALIA